MAKLNASILLVDACAESVFDLAAELRDREFHVQVAMQAEQAISIGVKQPFDLLICQSQLKGSTGRELLLQLRGKRRHNDLPVIWMTPGQRAGIALKYQRSIPEYSVRTPIPTDVLAQLVTLSIKQSRSRYRTKPIESARAAVAHTIPAPHLRPAQEGSLIPLSPFARPS